MPFILRHDLAAVEGRSGKEPEVADRCVSTGRTRATAQSQELRWPPRLIGPIGRIGQISQIGRGGQTAQVPELARRIQTGDRRAVYRPQRRSKKADRKARPCVERRATSRRSVRFFSVEAQPRPEDAMEWDGGWMSARSRDQLAILEVCQCALDSASGESCSGGD